MMGLRYEDASWWDYTSTLSVWNDRHSSDDRPREMRDPERMRGFLAAHSLH